MADSEDLKVPLWVFGGGPLLGFFWMTKFWDSPSDSVSVRLMQALAKELKVRSRERAQVIYCKRTTCSVDKRSKE